MAEYIPDNGWGGLSKYQLEDHRHMPLLLINGDIPPDNFKYGYTEDTEQLVRSQRNSQGVVIAEQIGRRLLKFNNLEWPIMSNSNYRWLQKQIEKFYCYVTYYDARYGSSATGHQTQGEFVTKQFYWGDFSAEPWQFYRDTDFGILIPSYYINVKVNLIDCGKDYVKPGEEGYVSVPAWYPPYRGNSQWPQDY